MTDQKLEPGKIIIDYTLSVRGGLDKETVLRYMAVYDQLPPVLVYHLPEGTYLLADGFHRLEAGKRLGKTHIQAEVREGTRLEAEEEAIVANIAHGQPYTRAQRREAACRMLRLHPERSDAWLARDLAMSANTIKAIRAELETTSQIDRLERLQGSDGKERPRELEARAKSVSPSVAKTQDISVPVDIERPDIIQPTVIQFPDIPSPQAALPLPENIALFQGNAIAIPLAPNSIHAAGFSLPYWAMRLYAGATQIIVWPGMSYKMPGGDITIAGEVDCEHEWSTQEQKIGRGKIGIKSTLTGGQNTQMMSRLVAPGQPAAETVGQAVSAAVCTRCGAWRGALGLEPDPETYVGHVLLILRNLRPIVRDDGTVSVNLGFSYYGSWGNYGTRKGEQREQHVPRWFRRGYEAEDGYKERPPTTNGHPIYKGKDIVPIPWLVGIAAQYDGWYLRSPGVWSKPNGRPDSARDRPVLDYEHILLLSKKATYYFDMHAVREPCSYAPRRNGSRLGNKEQAMNESQGTSHGIGSRRGDLAGRFRRATGSPVTEAAHLAVELHRAGWKLDRALRFALGQDVEERVPDGETLWRIRTKSYKGAHYATWPPALVARIIQATTSPAVCMRCGTPWRRVTERRGDDIGRTVHLGWQPECACFDHRPVWEGNSEGLHPACTVCGEPHTAPASFLDLTVGSGTSVQVARHLGRKGIGMDIALEYLAGQAVQRTAETPRLVVAPDLPVVVRRQPLPENTCLVGKMEDILPGLPREQVQLLFLDPPFNLDKVYGGGVGDKFDKAQYEELLYFWLDTALALVHPAGNVVLHHIPLWAARCASYLETRGWFLNRWIAWQTPAGRWSPHQLIAPRQYPFLWFSRQPQHRPNPVRVPHPVCTRCGGYTDDWGGKEKFRDPSGARIGDIWTTPTRVRGKRKTRPANELPVETILRWVLLLTQPGDYVFDPFLGSGTTAAACELSGRRWGGVELVRDNERIIRIKSMVARGAAVGDVAALPAAERYALTVALEKACGRLVQDETPLPEGVLLEAGRDAAQSVSCYVKQEAVS